MTSNIGTVITAVKSKLASSILYAKDSGYEDADVYELVQLNKYPFFNVTADDGLSIGDAEKIREPYGERWEFKILIHLGVQAMKMEIAKRGDNTRPGIYRFAEDVWAALKSDPTLGGVVWGMVPGAEITIDVAGINRKKDSFFLGAAEIRISFFKDVS